MKCSRMQRVSSGYSPLFTVYVYSCLAEHWMPKYILELPYRLSEVHQRWWKTFWTSLRRFKSSLPTAWERALFTRLSATLGGGTGSETKRSLGNWGISSPHDCWIKPLVPSEWQISEVFRWVANEAYFSTVLQKCQWHLISSSVKHKEKSAIALEKKCSFTSTKTPNACALYP